MIDLLEEEGDWSTETTLFGGSGKSDPFFPYGDRAWLAASFLKAGDEESYRRFRKSLVGLRRPSYHTTGGGWHEVFLYEFRDLFCSLELFENAVDEWNVQRYRAIYDPVRRLAERTWRRADAAGKSADVLQFVRNLPDDLRKVLLLDEISKLLDEAERTEDAAAIYRELVELAETMDYFEKTREHPFVRISIDEQDYRTAWKRMEILGFAFYGDDVFGGMTKNFARLAVRAKTDEDFERVARHAYALQFEGSETAALGFIAVCQYKLGREHGSIKYTILAQDAIGKKPDFSFDYSSPHVGGIHFIPQEFGIPDLIQCLVYMEKFETATRLYRAYSKASGRYDPMFEAILRGLLATDRKDRALDFFEEFGTRTSSFYSWGILQRSISPKKDPEQYERLREFLLRFFTEEDLKKKYGLDPVRSADLFKNIGNLFLGFGEKNLAWDAFQKALGHTMNIPEGNGEYRWKIQWIANDIMEHFGPEDAEEAYCQSIKALKGEKYSLAEYVCKRVEEYLYHSRKFRERAEKPKEEPTDPKKPEAPDAWKQYLIRNFYVED